MLFRSGQVGRIEGGGRREERGRYRGRRVGGRRDGEMRIEEMKQDKKGNAE